MSVFACATGALVSTAWAVAQRGAAEVPRQQRQGDPVARAYARGRFDELEQLLANRPAGDPAIVAWRARAAVARGRYAEAEKLLKPAATSAPTSDAALELGLLQMLLGRKADAVRTLDPIATAASGYTAASDLLRAAQAARALGRFREANDYFRLANSAVPDDAAVNAGWGELFLEKFQVAEAVRSFQDALRSDPEWVPAHIGLARTLTDENAGAARSAATSALKIDPAAAGGHLVLAELDLDEGKRDEARKKITTALEINPSSLEARALLAAIANLEGREADFRAEVARVLAINPVYGEVYRVAGDHAARNYRFEEAAALVRQGLTLDGDSSRALADLGVHLLRLGDEAEARQVLDRAFRLDPYDVVTYNLLGLLDTLEKFETVRAGDLTVKFDPEEAPVLREYVIPLAQEALKALGARYQFAPRGPLLIEVFPKHDDFAVRNVGLPGMVGALGACFGRVVTMDSPRARDPGTFNWGATLWHELAHVITLQMSNQRVPRWLTEGISVFEEKRARPEWGREMELAFVHALDQGQVLKLRDLNAGFTRAETIGLAYYQASLVVEHLVAAYGEAALHRLLRAYGEGLEAEAALKRALDVDFDKLQGGFDTMIAQKFGALRQAMKPPGTAEERMAASQSADGLKKLAADNPGSYPAQLALGRALLAAGDPDGAMKALERAAALVPIAVGKDSPHVLMAQIAEQRGDKARAMREIEALLAHDHTDVEAARKLATLAEEAADEKRLRLAFGRVVEIDPFDGAAHAALGRLALKWGEPGVAVRELRVALALEPVDRAAAHCDLGEGYLLAGQPADAKRQALAALEIAPSYERAQELLLKTVEVRQ